MPTKRFLALDVGGTKIRAGLVSEGGRLLGINAVASHERCSLHELLADIDASLKPLLRPGLSGLGIGFPALGDYRRGVLDGDRSLFPCVAGFPLRDSLSGRYGLPVRMTTDANLFALGVTHFGEGRVYSNILALTLGTGLGVGVILDGALCGGSRGIPEEVLRVLQQDDRPLSAAGHHFQRLYGADGATLGARAARGDSEALLSFLAIGRSLGQTVKRLLSVLPTMDVAIVGGGVAQSWRFLAPALRQLLTDVAVPVIPTRRLHPSLRGAVALFV